MPSSPIGPCSSGSTTVRSPDAAAASTAPATPTCRPVRGATAARPARRPARPGRPSASAQCPSRPMPIGVIRYRAGSTAASTWAAVTQLTSCSADCPPNSTTRWIRSALIGSTVPFGAGEDPGIRRGRAPPAARCAVPDVDARRRRRSTPVRWRPGQLFVPLVAERDGHDFVGAAAAAGAAATLGSRSDRHVDHGRRGRRHRRRADGARRRGRATGSTPTVVGITGSVGKTSTKDLVPRRRRRRAAGGGQRAQLQQRAGPAGHDPRRARRHRGARARDGHARVRRDRPAVRRRPARHRRRDGGGAVAHRARRWHRRRRPGQGRARRGAPGRRAPRSSTPTTSGSRRWPPRTAAGVITFGRSDAADVRISGLDARRTAPAPASTSTRRGGAPRSRSASAAPTWRSNAAAALAVAGVRRCRHRRRRRRRCPALRSARCGCNCSPPSAGGLVINDAYNANPTSMLAALDALAAVDAERRVAVLGGMAELADPDAAHRAVAARARRARRRADRRRHRSLRHRAADTGRGASRAVGPIGPGDGRARQGQPGVRARAAGRPPRRLT